MDSASMVEVPIQDGQALLDRLAEEGVVITAAGWVKNSESDQWNFVLATPLVGRGGDNRDAYLRILPIVHQMPAPFDVFTSDIRAVNPKHWIVKKAASRLGRAGWVRRELIDDSSVEALYLYAPRTGPTGE